MTDNPFATLLARIDALEAQITEAVRMLDEKDREYNRKTNDLIERHAAQIKGLEAGNHSINDSLSFQTNRAIAAEQQVFVLRKKTAKLVEAGKLARESIAAFMRETNRTAESGAGDILAQLDAAITEETQ